jgi:phenylpropionate dioxygenase-like ring-hydroxylating dioxygenase large terminal subunit
MTANGRSMRGYVDTANGEVSREIFVSQDIYDQEIERIFGRAWLYVGHESQVPNPGDFFLSSMGEESVILTRDRTGKLHVFLNTCRHRGMRVCRYDEGNTTNFVCPYHAWSYATDGRLVGVQDYENLYKPPFDRGEWGLVEVAQMTNFLGTIWATWDPDAPPFEDTLGAARESLDSGLRAWDGGNGGTELLGSVQKWMVPSNWKFVSENFAGDFLHNVSHRSVDMVGIAPGAGPGRREETGYWGNGACAGGHGFVYRVVPPNKDWVQFSASPETSAYFSECWRKRIDRQGAKAGVISLVGTIFPNMSFHGYQPRTILVAHPRGVQRTEMWRVYFVDRGTPEPVKDFLRRYYIRYSGPGGMTEQDDMENWNYASAASEGLISRRYPYHYKAGLGTGGPHELIPGHVATAPRGTEQNPRNFYDQWARCMDARDWGELGAAGGSPR